MNERTLVIAEIGVNHNKDVGLAREMILAAAEAGADVIKFQTAIPELVQTMDAPKAEYQELFTAEMPTAMDMTRSFHFEHEVFIQLKREVERAGCEFLSTAFDLQSLRFLQSLEPQRYKIPSGEITNAPYLKQVARSGKPVILSTGMADLDEIGAAVDLLLAEGTKSSDVTLMQCTTSYPTPDEDVNLLTMESLRARFGVAVGLSDHSVGTVGCVAAVAMGAVVVEKHFTTSRDLPGPDQATSLVPEEFKAMVSEIRRVEAMRGSSSKIVTDSEVSNRSVVRRGVYSARDLPAGHVLTEDDLVCLRPLSAISAMEFFDVVGRRLMRPVSTQQALAREDLG